MLTDVIIQRLVGFLEVEGLVSVHMLIDRLIKKVQILSPGLCFHVTFETIFQVCTNKYTLLHVYACILHDNTRFTNRNSAIYAFIRDLDGITTLTPWWIWFSSLSSESFVFDWMERESAVFEYSNNLV